MDIMDKQYIKASMLGDWVRNMTRHTVIVTADDVLAKCTDEQLDYYYYRIIERRF